MRENVNARYLTLDDIGERADIITVDVSFISLKKIIPAALPLLAPGGLLVTLVKPQFEVGRYQVGKGGIVKDEERIRAVIDDIRQFGEQCGLRARDDGGGAEGEGEKEQGVLHPMGTVKVPPPVQFFASIIFGDSGILSQVEAGADAARRPHSGKDGDRLLFPIGLLPP